MHIQEAKAHLLNIDSLKFKLPDGSIVPQHFHVTEVGIITKKFIDCGGTLREEKVTNFQLWSADDYDHRLQPKKLLNIIELSQDKLGIENEEIEMEYQSETIGKYGLDFVNGYFVLNPKMTDCLAKDNCGIPVSKPKVNLPDLKANTNTCSPNSGCC